jgi:hypothetical protein
MKKCIKCNIEKEIEFFGKNKRSKDGFRNECKDCRKESSRKYRENNKDKLREIQKKFKENNPDYFKEYSEKNKKKLKEYKKSYREENREEINENRRKYREENKEKINEYQREYRKNNKEKFKNYYEENKEYYNKRYKEKRKSYIRNYFRIRKQKDPLFRLSCNIRRLVSNSINKEYEKNSKTEEILGCNFKEFKIHLESKFEDWMNWENYGIYDGEFGSGWDIDHIIPLSSANTEEEIIKLNNYINLQPLCSKVNRDIKRDDVDYSS